jgi:hypothetical protein
MTMLHLLKCNGAVVVCITGLLTGGCESGSPDAREAPGTYDFGTFTPDCFGLDLETPPLVLGADESADGVFFSSVAAAAVLQDGTVAVADGRVSSWWWIFSSSGRVLARLGEPREGPGGFHTLFWLRTSPSGGFLTFDFLKGELAYFGPDGLFLKARRTTTSAGLPAGAHPRAGPLPDGRFVYAGGSWTPPSAQGRVVRGARELWVEGGERREPLRFGQVVDSEMYREEGVGFFNRLLPFGRLTSVFVLGNRVVIATGDETILELVDPDSGRWDTLAVPLESRALTSGEIREFKEAWLADIEVRHGTEDAVRESRRIADEIPYPAWLPPYGRVRPDPLGYIWVAMVHPDERRPERYLVVDTLGVVRDTVSLPAGIELLDVGPRHILGRARDAFDVESVMVIPRSCAR